MHQFVEKHCNYCIQAFYRSLVLIGILVFGFINPPNIYLIYSSLKGDAILSQRILFMFEIFQPIKLRQLGVNVSVNVSWALMLRRMASNKAMNMDRLSLGMRLTP